jgi:putative ATPase
MAFFDALKEVDREDAEVPNHLRDASRDSVGFGHGEGYVYPHAYRNHWAAQQYLPTALRGRTFYVPSAVGYEGKIREEVLQKRELQAAVVLGDGPESTTADGELLSWSATAKGREGWFRRLESGRSALLLADRNALFNAAAPARHDRVLIPIAGDGLLLWESLRRCPEGLSAALVASDAAREALYRYATALDQSEQPEIAVLDNELLPTPEQADEWFSTAQFDHILIREPWRKGFAKNADAQDPQAAFAGLASRAKTLLAGGGGVVLLASPPPLGQRISAIIGEHGKLSQAEDTFFSQPEPWNWNADQLKQSFQSQGFNVSIKIIDQQEERLIGTKDIDAWFDQKNSRWGAFMGKTLDPADFSQVEEALRQRIQEGPLCWKWKSLLLSGKIKNS